MFLQLRPATADLAVLAVSERGCARLEAADGWATRMMKPEVTRRGLHVRVDDEALGMLGEPVEVARVVVGKCTMTS
jgi:hypothetical protein